MNWKAVLFVLLFFTSCKNDEVKIPNDVFSKEKMTNLLVEIHLSDAIAADERIKDVKLLNEIKKAYFTSVLEKNNIKEEDFESSLAFYQDHPNVFFEIYENVMIVLSEQEADLNGEKTKETSKNQNKKNNDE